MKLYICAHASFGSFITCVRRADFRAPETRD